MNKPLVSIIIVNWNGQEVFADCLKTLESLKYSNWELIVVDNGSIDGSSNLASEYSLKAKNYILIQNKDNKGFAEGNNQGFLQSNGEYVLLLNNDTRVSPDFLDIMVDRMEKDDKVSAMQPKIFLMDMPGYLDNCGAFLTQIGFLQHWGFMQKDGSEFDIEKEIFSAKGACLLIRRNIIKKIGLFDDDFGSYFEETDFCWRIWLCGGKVLYYPKAHIWHKLGATSKKMDQIQVNFNSFKNRILSLVKNLDSVQLISILIPHLIIVTGLGVFYLLKLQFRKAWMIFSAIVWNFINIIQTIKKRRQIQKIRFKNSNSFLNDMMVKASFYEMFLHFQKVEANFK